MLPSFHDFAVEENVELIFIGRIWRSVTFLPTSSQAEDHQDRRNQSYHLNPPVPLTRLRIRFQVGDPPRHNLQRGIAFETTIH